MTDDLKAADFLPLVNTPFRWTLPDGQVIELLLTEVSEGRQSPIYEEFSLAFRGPVNGPRLSQIFPLHHDQLGELSLFLSPFKLDQGGLYYEAAFNRLLKS